MSNQSRRKFMETILVGGAALMMTPAWRMAEAQVAGRMAKRIMLTVDVEAMPKNAKYDPVERLIWGKYPQDQAGIGEMMDIAENHNAKLTMFLDYCERDIHGDLIMQVGSAIHKRGHDLQLHAHPDFMSNDFFTSKGVARINDLNDATAAQAAVLFDFLVTEHQRCIGEKPIAYRGGGYRFNANLLKAMAERGILLHSSYNPNRKTQPLQFDFAKQFKWSNGCVEVPISCVRKYRNLTHPVELNFNKSTFSSVGRMLECLADFHTEFGDNAIAVLVMHSWSFLQRDKESGFFSTPLSKNVERFDAFLAAVSQTHEIVTATDVLALEQQGELALDPPLDLSIFSQ